MNPGPSLKNQDHERLNVVLYTILEALRWVAFLLLPIMPASAPKMMAQLGLPPEAWEAQTLPGLSWGQLAAGTTIDQGGAVVSATGSSGN